MKRDDLMRLAVVAIGLAIAGPALVWLAEALVPAVIVGTVCFAVVRAVLYLTNRW